MKRITTALILAITLALVSASAEAARMRPRLIDQDMLELPGGDVTADLRLFRTPNGFIILQDILVESLSGHQVSPPRTTPLGLQMPGGSTWGNYTASDDGTVYLALASSARIHVLELGDLTTPGPLAPVALDSIAPAAGFDPASTQMGIIAVLIGLFVDRNVPAVSFVDGTSNTIMLGFDGTRFRPVHLIEEDGLYSF
jgi:hypothetical protein